MESATVRSQIEAFERKCEERANSSSEKLAQVESEIAKIQLRLDRAMYDSSPAVDGLFEQLKAANERRSRARIEAESFASWRTREGERIEGMKSDLVASLTAEFQILKTEGEKLVLVALASRAKYLEQLKRLGEILDQGIRKVIEVRKAVPGGSPTFLRINVPMIDELVVDEVMVDTAVDEVRRDWVWANRT